jgi:hypothetical protein
MNRTVQRVWLNVTNPATENAQNHANAFGLLKRHKLHVQAKSFVDYLDWRHADASRTDLLAR